MFEKLIKLAVIAILALTMIAPLNADAADESLLSKDRKYSTAGYTDITARLTIISDNGKSESRYGMPCYGHTFLVIQNTSDLMLDLCGRVLAPGENLTIGWWAISSHSGVWFGIEPNYIAAYGRYPDRVGLSRDIDGDGVSRLVDYILTHDLYTPLENCAVRAVAAFNEALPENNGLKCGYFVTPAKVCEAIIAHDGSAEDADIDFSPITPSCGFADNIDYYSFAVKKEKK